MFKNLHNHNTSVRRNGFMLFLLMFFGLNTLWAQRLELRFNKEFSNNEIANQSLGGGGSFIFDEWVKNVDFQLNFDYAGYRSEKVVIGREIKYDRFKYGVSALYVIPFKNPHFLFRVGGDISYCTLKKVYSFKTDSLYSYETHRGGMLGLGPMINVQAKVGQKDFFRIGVSVIPTYLIPLHAKVDRVGIEPEFKKGFFDLQLQIGIEFRLGN